jgi:hypothetical protein
LCRITARLAAKVTAHRYRLPTMGGDVVTAPTAEHRALAIGENHYLAPFLDFDYFDTLANPLSAY